MVHTREREVGHKKKDIDGMRESQPRWTNLMMISDIPTTPCLSTSSATEKALWRGVFSGMIWSNLANERKMERYVRHGLSRCHISRDGAMYMDSRSQR